MKFNIIKNIFFCKLNFARIFLTLMRKVIYNFKNVQKIRNAKIIVIQIINKNRIIDDAYDFNMIK